MDLWLSSGIVFGATLLEFLGLPAPGGPLLVLLAAEPATSPTQVLFLMAVAGGGAALGDAPWFFLGRYGGGRVLHFYCKFTLGSRACVMNTERFFHQYGILTLAFSKFFPGVRLFAPPFAGFAGYPFKSFLYLDLLGGFLWAGALALLGRILGPQMPWAFTTQWAWFFTFAPVAIFLLARLARRVVKGPAEEAFPLKSKPEVSGAVSAITKGTAL